MTPFVSVLMAVYNGARFVAAAIDSILAQTLAAGEVIVVDDGSTDETPAVLASFGRRLTVIRQDNRGLSASRNRGVALARGPYVALIDHDDLWEPTYLQHTVPRLAALDASTAGVVAGWVNIDDAGRVLPGTETVLRGRLCLRDFLVQNLCPTGAIVLRYGALLEVGGFDERLVAAQDWGLWLRLTAAGHSFVAVEECLWRYRLHAGNMSGDPDVIRDDALLLLADIYARPSVPEALRPLRAQAIAYAHLHASTAHYARGRAAAGDAEFAAAVRAWPDLLGEDETYYATLCAEQPPGRKATPEGLDLERGEARLMAALARCFAGGGSDAFVQRRAGARAYRSLAQLAYGQRRMATVRRYAGRALRADAGLWSDWGTIGLLIKSLAGGAAIDRLSRWRRRAAT